MAQDSLFRELCKPETLRIGWHLAQLDSRDDFVEDPLRNSDFASQLQVRLSFISEQLVSGRYRPRHLLEVDIPKSALTVRPGNVLPIEEAIILHAIVYLIAPRLDPLLSRQVYSYRLHADWRRRLQRGRSLFRDDDLALPFLRRSTIKRFDPMESWYIAWPEFDRARKKALQGKKYTHLAKADISAYFENIDLRLLDDLLRQRLRYEPKLLSLIFRILNAWTRDTASGVPVGRGLPQGNDVSSFLGNLYLLPLDRALARFCSRTGCAWFRYVDDLDILTPSYETARQAVLLANSALRSLHLNLQGSKTHILFGRELRAEYTHAQSDEATAIIQRLGEITASDAAATARRKKLLSQAAPLARGFTRNLPRALRSLNEKDSRLLRRLFTLYGSQKSPRLRRCALACLRERPERRVLEKALRYVTNLDYRFHDRLAAELLDIAVEEHGGGNYYQVALLIQTIGQLHPKSSDGLVSRIRPILWRARPNWLVNQKALETLFNLPSAAQAAEHAAARFLTDEHPWVRRAAAALVLKGRPGFVREQMGRLVFHPDTSVQLPALMWKRYECDADFRRHELQRLQSIADDHGFMRNSRTLWALGGTCVAPELDRFRLLARGFLHSKSAIVQWHARELSGRIGAA
jgi:hypothetical protein